MKRHFGLPVTFAAALHGALLFGISGSPRPPVESKPSDTRRIEVPLPVPEEPPEAVASGSPLLENQARARSEESVAEAPSAPVVTAGPSIPTVDRPRFTIVPDTGPVLSSGLFQDGGGTGGAIDGMLLDNPPRTRLQVAPMFPHAARREGLSGEVVVDFEVDENGSVRSPRVASATHSLFAESALRAVSRWQFEPGRRHGRVVRFRMTVPIRFTVEP